jgi:ferric-dicitrate binding protein FerR (iron transport regulator)
VWSSREDFTTPEMLDAFLHQAVHEAAARINSRHVIAHQLAEHEGAHAPKAVAKPAPSVDEAWKKVNATLHPNVFHAANVAHEMAAHSRHEAAGHITEMTKSRPWGPVLAFGLAFVVLVGGFYWWASRGREISDLVTAVSATDTHVTATGYGEFNKASLGDGSNVQVGPDSRLRVPRTYGNSVRGTQLEGTAVFTVAPGQKGTFIVIAGNTVIRASGTEFVVRAYPDESSVTVRVLEGTVTVTVGDSTQTVAKDAALVIAKDNTMHAPSAAELVQSVGWTDGTIVAADRTVKEIVVIAKRWFGVQLFIKDTALLARKASVSAKIGAGEVAIASIEKSGGLRREWEGTNMVLTDATAKAHKAP